MGKLTKIVFEVALFEDRSVGIDGGIVPFTVQVESAYWNFLDTEGKEHTLKRLGHIALDIIEPEDGEIVDVIITEVENA